LEKHGEQLSNIDKYFFLDLAGGQRKLEEILLAKCSPTSETYISVNEAVKENEKVLECDLYNFSSEGAQGAFKAAHQLLCQIQQGVAILSNRNGMNFLQAFVRSQYFVVFFEKRKIWFGGDKGAIKKAASDDLLRGSEALKAMCPNKRAKRFEFETARAIGRFWPIFARSQQEGGQRKSGESHEAGERPNRQSLKGSPSRTRRSSQSGQRAVWHIVPF